MKVGILGGSGFVGTHLSQKCVENGHQVLIFSRNPDKVETSPALQAVQWPLDSSDESINVDDMKMKDIDCVVNLAGETINQRWTDAAKERILYSRIRTTRQLVGYIEQRILQPQVLINASAVGYYGFSSDKEFNESSPAADDFLAQVSKKWEEEAEHAVQYGVRVVQTRLGVVLGRKNGALPRMTLPYKLLVGGKIGSGKQWVPWIHIDDVAGLMLYALEKDNIHGAVNATAPKPVQNQEFGKTIASVLKKPHWIPAPAFALRILFGEMADLILKGQYVLPEKSIEHGYTFQYPTVDQALQDLLG